MRCWVPTITIILLQLLIHSRSNPKFLLISTPCANFVPFWIEIPWLRKAYGTVGNWRIANLLTWCVSCRNRPYDWAAWWYLCWLVRTILDTFRDGCHTNFMKDAMDGSSEKKMQQCTTIISPMMVKLPLPEFYCKNSSLWKSNLYWWINCHKNCFNIVCTSLLLTKCFFCFLTI